MAFSIMLSKLMIFPDIFTYIQKVAYLNLDPNFFITFSLQRLNQGLSAILTSSRKGIPDPIPINILYDQ